MYRAIHRWLVHLLSFGATLILVFDGWARSVRAARYPPKAVQAHKDRADDDKKHSDAALLLDGAHPSGLDPEADKLWNRVVHRQTLLDLVAFTLQLARALHVRCWARVSWAADHQMRRGFGHK